MTHHSNCPLCDSANTGIFLRTSDYFLSGESFELWKCSQCGFVFTYDPPDESNIGHYYESDDYLSHNDSAKGFFGIVYRAVRKLMLVRKTGMVRKASGLKTGEFLDIGSGTGHFLSAMKNSGWRVRGIEINEKAREYSISEFGLQVLAGDKVKSLQSQSLNVVTLWHVLEHFNDPFSLAEEIRRIIKPGGVCLIALPNSGSFDAEHYKEFWAAYDVPRHLWHFEPSTIDLYAKKTGFKVVGTRTLPLDVFYISILSEKYKNSALPFITGVIKGLWFAMRSCINKDRCSSLIYFLQRKPE
ncbi:MAG: class I SAM-dependent methyltransferase [Bacteroidales bacterium]|jgi:SAM-dependent methyltransferase